MNVNNLPEINEAVKIAERLIASDKRLNAVVMEFWSVTAGCEMECTVHRDGRMTGVRKL